MSNQFNGEGDAIQAEEDSDLDELAQISIVQVIGALKVEQL